VVANDLPTLFEHVLLASQHFVTFRRCFVVGAAQDSTGLFFAFEILASRVGRRAEHFAPFGPSAASDQNGVRSLKLLMAFEAEFSDGSSRSVSHNI
jgi:hypothetical protein